MLLIVEMSIRRGIYYSSIYRYAEADNKYMKNYDRNKESSYLRYWNVNKLYEWAMSKKLPKSNCKWVEGTSQFKEDVIKNYNEKSEERYFLEADVQYLEKLYEFYSDLPFLIERKKLKKAKKLVANYMMKLNMFYT